MLINIYETMTKKVQELELLASMQHKQPNINPSRKPTWTIISGLKHINL